MTKPNNYIFVADNWQLIKKTKKNLKLLSVFSNLQSNSEVPFEDIYLKLRKRDKILSRFYDDVFLEVTKIHQRLLNNFFPTIDICIRQILVSLISVYIDRAVRLIELLKYHENKKFLIGEINFNSINKRNDSIRTASSNSWEFNQSLINYLLKSCGIKKSLNINSNDYFRDNHDKHQKKLMFYPQVESFFDKILIRIKNNISFKLRKPSKKNQHFLSLGFSGDDYFLGLGGFYNRNGYFSRLGNEFKIKDFNINKNLREKFKYEIDKLFDTYLETILSKFTGCSRKSYFIQRLSKCFSAWFAYNFPSNFLEGFSENLLMTQQYLKHYNHKKLIGTSLVTDESIFLGMVLKNHRGQIIGVQHGGYYGYIESMTLMCETEYDFYDKIFTWGWQDFDKNLPSAMPIISPSIRLSEKPILLNNINQMLHIRKRLKILFMPGHILRFPHIANCGAPRPDFASYILEFRHNLIKRLIKENFFVGHKPYNFKNFDYNNYFKDFKIFNESKNYNLLLSNQKGLSPKLIKNFNIVVWDQIGSGALDCFVSGIPTMIIWKRIFSRESKFATSYINELEKYGVVHKELKSFLFELKKFEKDPKKWFENKNRQCAIKKFCSKFARTDVKWNSVFKNKLDDLIRF